MWEWLRSLGGSGISAKGWIPRKGLDYRDLQVRLAVSEKQNKWANGGPGVKKLSNLISRHLQLPRDWVVIPTNSGTAALQALVWAWSLEVGDWVVPAYSWSGLDTAFRGIPNITVVDVDRETATLPIKNYLECGTVLTTFAGHLPIRGDYLDPSMRVIWDNCGSADLVYPDLGRADGIALSFHHTKPWGFGEGGAAAVPIRLADRVMQAVGYSYSGPTVLNGKMSEVQAALVTQRWGTYNRVKQHATKLRNVLLGALTAANISFSTVPHWGKDYPFSGWVPIKLKDPIQGVEITGRVIGGVVTRQLYRPRGNFPEAMDWYNRVLAIPIHEGLRESDMVNVVKGIEKLGLTGWA